MYGVMRKGWGFIFTALLLVMAAVFAPPPASAATLDVLYDGPVALETGKTFDVTAYNSGTSYAVKQNTPLGALHAAAVADNFTFDVTDKNIAASGALLLDNVGDYKYVKGGSKWYAYVNDDFKDGYNNPAGALNLLEIKDGDRVEFYFAAGVDNGEDFIAVKAAATAAVKTVVGAGGGTPVAPTESASWTLQLAGAKDFSVTKSYFEEGLACASSGHQVFWTDTDGNVWGGVPLWLLVGMVDDNPDTGDKHINFNDALAQKNYKIEVIAADGWSATFESSAIAHNNGYIVANTLNGKPLPAKTAAGKDSWPLHLKGPAVFGGQQVGKIVKIQLSDMPAPTTGWTLEMLGQVGDTVTQAEYEAGLACANSGHLVQWTDKSGNVWSGVPLWALLGVVDDIETGDHWTFNDAAAQAGYSINVIAGDGYTKTFDSKTVANSSAFIVANRINGSALTEAGPLRLVGSGVVKADGTLGGSAVGSIARIEIPDLQTPVAKTGSWNLSLSGKITDVISQAEFEAGLACPASGHLVNWTDKDGNVWSGIPLYCLTGWVDDRKPHNFSFTQATAGYTILVKAGDGYTKEFASTDVASSTNYIVANKVNGAALKDGGPLRLVGAGVTRADGTLGGTSVGNIKEIELTEFATAIAIPKVHIVKYGADNTTILKEITVDYPWMEKNLPIVGDGVTKYRYEGVTNIPSDVWDAAETYPGGFKIENAIKGTRVKDLCAQVGGMVPDTEIVFVASDGYETRLPYSSIYTNAAVQARQGDAVLAWWADGKYVPAYSEGMRLFFTPGGDHVYGQWDMHETLPSKYWHYYFSDNVQYASCAGLSPKYITEIRLYTVPMSDWVLHLDGRSLGGVEENISKTYFEQALACQFGANHKVSYTDSKGRAWTGMPLWFLGGYVDDADKHSNQAFNETLAAGGYLVTITASDGYAVTFNSKDIIRSSDFIVANSLNGAAIPETDSSWPLRLVGPEISGSNSISKIAGIKLAKIPVLNDISGHWAQVNIQALIETGVISGYPDNSFKPETTISRAEFATILAKAFKLTPKAGSEFADTANHWAKNYISWAAAAGIVSGYSPTSFGPDDLITREQMAVMIVKAAELEIPAGDTAFTDKGKISEWAKDAVAAAVNAGFIKGNPDNTMAPQNNATRAEAVTVILNALKS